MKREFDITVLTHPIVDVVVECVPEVFEVLGLEQGSWARTSVEQQAAILREVKDNPALISMGGSLANSVTLAALLGRTGAMLGLAGDDLYGKLFADELKSASVVAANDLVPGARTATCLSLVNRETGERTMRTCHGVAAEFGREHVSQDVIQRSSWLMLEGYSLSTSPMNSDGLFEALEVARRAGTKVAFSAAAEFVARHNGEQIHAFLPSVDLLFANEAEALTLTGARSPREALDRLLQTVPSVLVTLGARGAIGAHGDDYFEVPTFPARIVDATGAGDAFAGAYLAGVCAGLTPRAAARGASCLAAKVVSQKGARLDKDAVSAWTAAVA